MRTFKCSHLYFGYYVIGTRDLSPCPYIRYIHRNPIKAGLVKDISEYKWSSYNEYIKEADVISKEFVFGMFSIDKEKAKELFSKFNYQKNSDMCLEDEDKIRVSDSELKEKLMKFGVANISEFRQIEKNERNELIRKLKSIEGVTTRQISRITGISKSMINRI